MENTFSPLSKAYRCKNQYESFVSLNYLFQSVGDICYWQRKISDIQVAVFDHSVDYEKTPPELLIYTGQLLLKVLYASIHLQDFPPIAPQKLAWIHLADSWIRKHCTKESEELQPLQILKYGPKHLSSDEILNPSALIQEFFQKRSLKKWVKRWNQFREMAFFNYSVFDGDEGEYLEDFTYFKKLLEASYLIYVRYSTI